MLPDYKSGLKQTPLRFRHVHEITIVASTASGVATLVTAESSPQTTVALNGTGRYDVTMPKGMTMHLIGAYSEKSTAPAVSDGTVFTAGLLSATAGTATVWVQRPDTGAAANPADGKIRFRFELTKV
jgi:hypothetical protein